MTVVVDVDGITDRVATVGVVRSISTTEVVVEHLDGTMDSWLFDSIAWRTSKQILSSPQPGYRKWRLRAVKYVFGDESK